MRSEVRVQERRRVYRGRSLAGFASLVLAMAACGEEAPPKPTKTEFVWDFSTATSPRYSYHFTATQLVFQEGDDSSESEQLSRAGTASVVGKDGLANVELQTPEEPAPLLLIEGMKEDGRAPHNDFERATLLPLPSIDLKEGESDQLDLEMEVKFNGRTQKLRVTHTLTHAGPTTIAGHSCILLKGEILGPRRVYEGFGGEMSGSLSGTGSYCFDVDNHRYVSAKVEYSMRSRLRLSDRTLLMGQDFNIRTTMQILDED